MKKFLRTMIFTLCLTPLGSVMPAYAQFEGNGGGPAYYQQVQTSAQARRQYYLNRRQYYMNRRNYYYDRRNYYYNRRNYYNQRRDYYNQRRNYYNSRPNYYGPGNGYYNY